MPSSSEINAGQRFLRTSRNACGNSRTISSNSLETIVQANYLVRQIDALQEEARQWVEMTDKAAESASRINRRNSRTSAAY